MGSRGCGRALPLARASLSSSWLKMAPRKKPAAKAAPVKRPSGPSGWQRWRNKATKKEVRSQGSQTEATTAEKATQTEPKEKSRDHLGLVVPPFPASWMGEAPNQGLRNTIVSHPYMVLVRLCTASPSSVRCPSEVQARSPPLFFSPTFLPQVFSLLYKRKRGPPSPLCLWHGIATIGFAQPGFVY